LAKKNSWAIKPIERKPFKIIRYTFAKIPNVTYNQQVLSETITNENENSAYHYIMNGYYCIHETADNGFYHIGYDKKKQLLYEYRWYRGMGPYKEIDINPTFYEK
jgi:hypothetical protein